MPVRYEIKAYAIPLVLLLALSHVSGAVLVKTPWTNSTYAGEELGYTITYSVDSNDSELLLVDSLPNGLIFINSSMPCNLTSGNLTCPLNSTTGSVNITAMVNFTFADGNFTFGESIPPNRVYLNYTLNGTAYTLFNQSATVAVEPAMLEIASPALVHENQSFNITITGYTNESSELSLNLSGLTAESTSFNLSPGIFNLTLRLRTNASTGEVALINATLTSASATLSRSVSVRVVPLLRYAVITSKQGTFWRLVEDAKDSLEWNNTLLSLKLMDGEELNANNETLEGYDLILMYMVGYKENLYAKIENVTNTSAFIALSTSYYNDLITVNSTVLKTAQKYADNGGEENTRRLLTYLAVEVLSANETAQPVILVPYGAFHPDYRRGEHPCPSCIFTNLSSYMEWYRSTGRYNASAPTIGVVFYKSYYTSSNLGDVIALIREIESRGANVIAVTKSSSAVEKFFLNGSSATVDAVITQHSFRFNYFNPEQGLAELSNLSVPWLKAISLYYQSQDEWLNSTQGITTSEIAWQVAMPELDGVIEPTVLSAKESDGRRVVIPDRLDRIVSRALNWAQLRRLNNSEKRIAFIYYNNPPGRDNIRASYLNVPASLEVILNAMKARGYYLGNFSGFNVSINASHADNSSLLHLLLESGRNIGVWRQEDVDALAQSGRVVLISEEKYRKWFSTLPEKLQQQVIEEWGSPPGEQMVFENSSGRYILIPSVRFGNVLLAPEPYRGFLNSEDKIYHNTSLPPNHQYIAFYLWLKKEFKPSAMVHVGTHATVEWTPGKQVGLDNTSWPDVLLSDIPHPYIYVMDNVGEGTQAKRRGYATIIDHLTPALIPGELYGNLSEIYERIDLYRDAKANNKTLLMQQYREEILQLAKAEHLDRDLNVTLDGMSDAEFEAFLGELKDYLTELKYENIPYGLHTFGIPPEGDALVTFVMNILGRDYTSATKQVNSSCGERCSFELLKAVLNGSDVNQAQVDFLGNVSANVTEQLELALDYAGLLTDGTRGEIDSLLDAFEGRYIKPNVGGDPLRAPEALPTGRNFYSFDPRGIPTTAAWKVGRALTDAFLSDYVARHGTYPRKVAYLLWATETMRHRGVAEAQILYLLGVEPKWKRGRVYDVQLINESQLGRPRIDVVIVTSGLYRDTFTYQLQLLDRAVMLAASASNSSYPNYVRENYLAMRGWLLAMGYNSSDAERLAMARIFSEPPGDYGVRVAAAAEASNTWESTDKIAQIYIQRLGNVYIDGSFYTLSPELFKENLKGTEAALFTRTSNLYGAFDNDDVFQYFGGLSLAIGYASGGARPEMWIANLRDRDNARMETLQDFLNRELRSRLYNPKWIQGMMEQGYSGASMFSKTLENLWGWQVVDERMISPEVWDALYEIYARDKYSLGLDEWFREHSPWTKQSMYARMLEAVRKGYWSPSEDVQRALAEELQELIEVYGVACCHHTCANPLLDKFIQGLLSVPGVKPASYHSDDSGWDYEPVRRAPVNATAEDEGQNETTSQAEQEEKAGSAEGFGTRGEQGAPADTSASTAGESVRGRVLAPEEMEEEGAPSSAVPLRAVILAVGTFSVLGYGFLRLLKRGWL